MKNAIAILLFTGLIAACNSSTVKGQEEPTKTTTMSKKETVGVFLTAAIKNEPATMRKLANADYIQHNPHIPTGLEPFIKMLPILQENGTTAENIRMFRDGNYVFMHNIWHKAQPAYFGLTVPPISE